jgi:hypothetical protein
MTQSENVTASREARAQDAFTASTTSYCRSFSCTVNETMLTNESVFVRPTVCCIDHLRSSESGFNPKLISHPVKD